MGKQKHRRKVPAEKRFERAMVDSTDLLADLIADVELPIRTDDSQVFELARLIHDGQPSFRDEEFRMLVELSIRLDLNNAVDVRAEMVDRIRRALPGMTPAARRIAPDVIGAIEDVEFSLDRVGAVVRSYTNQLFCRLEEMPDSEQPTIDGRNTLEQWRAGQIDRAVMFERLRKLGAETVTSVADMLFESLADPSIVETAIELLSMYDDRVSARVLAYLVSEPMLEEDQEAIVRSILKERWPASRNYILYKLKAHTHEDLPFRWFELLVETGEPRAADRILEEVAVHGTHEQHREDLKALLGLLDRSKDPGLTGKVLNLMTEEAIPEAAQELVEEWAESSAIAADLEEALDSWNEGRAILVRGSEDFNSFASGQLDRGFDEIRADRNAAYHESLGWQRRADFPRGPMETEFEQELADTMMGGLSLNPQLDEAALRHQVESFRENWLMTPRDGVIPLVAIYLERSREKPWLEEIYWSEINSWYVKTAQAFDEGNADKARQYLDVLLGIEPDYPLAIVLDRIMVEDFTDD